MSTGHDLPSVDVRERGNDANGQPITLDRRLFMQLLAFSCRPEHDPSAVVAELGHGLVRAGISAVVYEDVNHPRGLALLSFSESPEDFVTKVRPLLAGLTKDRLELRPELT